MTPILQTENLTKRFGELAAVDNLTFEVDKGIIYGIAGPNGAGKTTLFNLLSGVHGGEGEVLFQGERIESLRPYQIGRKGLARTFQVPSLFETLSIYDNVRVGAHFGNQSSNEDDIIYETLEFVGLHDLAGEKGECLSLFDKKRTMLASALAMSPKLLLLDEPNAGLSPREIDESVALFRKINDKKGITLIVIEHLMKVLVSISDKMMILHNGKKIAHGEPKKVIKEPQVIEVYIGAGHAEN